MNTPNRDRPRVRVKSRAFAAATLATILIVSLTQLTVGAQEPTTTTTESTTTTGSTTTTAAPTTSTSESTTTSTTAAPTAEQDVEGPIAALVVPVPSATQSVITVKVGGTHAGPSAVLPQAGVTLQLFDSAATATPTTFVTPNTCVSDVDGDCNWIVDNTGTGGTNRDRRFWVRQIAPAGPNTYTSPQLNVGTGPWPATNYQFQTCLQLRGGQTCSSTATGVNGFMLSTTTADAAFTASGGIWQTSRTNPTLSARCGLRVALVLDVSGSVAPDIPQLRTAATTFVSTLVGTPSSVGLFTFASSGPANTTNNQNRPLTSVSTGAGANTVNGWINGVTAQTGNTQFTNWDRALNQVTESPQAYDIAVIVTDGDPTAYGVPSVQTDGRTRFREIENGIFSANGLKAEGTRVVAFGVGAGVGGSGLNLRSISGPTLGSDYFQTTDYPQAAGVLRALALGACQGTVSVIKQVIPPGGTIADATPAAGWTFGATTSTAGVTIDPTSGQTDATGGINFGLTFPGGTSTAAVTLTETQQAGFTLVQQAGANATCRRIDTQAAVPTTNSGALGFQLSADATVPISCTVYNQAPNPPATVQVNKQWTVNGVNYANGAQPPGLSAQLSIAGVTQPFGAVVGGFNAAQTVAINETVTNQLPLCTVTGQTVTLANGTPVNAALPYSATLVGGANTYTITNVVTCTSNLQLTKSVANGPALPTAWTLTAIAPTGALAGPTGTTGVAGNVTPGVIYALAESGGDPRYVQDDQRAAPVPGSTGSWRCVVVDANGGEVPGFSDGINGGVTVPLGQRVRCTATNRTSELTLRKVVNNNFGGTADPSAWTLTATPTGTPPPGVLPQSVPGSEPGTVVFVRPGQEYSLSESGGPAGYQLVSIECAVDESPPAPAATIILTAGETGVCTYTNEDIQPTLTLVKQVDNGTGAGSALATDWTLTADGPTTISGATGTPAVTAAGVDAGSYDLSETGPTGYTASSWLCTGATSSTATSVDLGPGENATCTITNTAIAPRLTLVKTVTNDNGGGATPDAWTLSATGPISISGATGSGTVTDAVVQVGTYTLSETGPAGYTPGTWSCDGATVTNGQITLDSGDDATCTINNDDQPAQLTLVKTVTNDNGGTAVPVDWTLNATGPTTISGETGSGTVTDALVPAGAYTLSESGPAGYTASDWSCVVGESSPVSGSSLVLGNGDDATCTINNDDQPATITLFKTVTNDNGGTALPTAWRLRGAGPTVFDGATGSVAVTNRTINAGTYALTEGDGPTGYAAGPWGCVGGGTLSGNSITLANGQNAVCGLNNDDEPATVTLVKTVVNDNGGTAAATDWTLSADGPDSISGVTGSDEVTGAVVPVGPYTLTESGGPAGYTASAWVCVDGETAVPVEGNIVALAGGSSVTCTITNDDVPVSWDLNKVSDPPSGTVVAPGDTITYTLTATNTGGVAPTGLTVNDDLADVLDNATLVPGSVTFSTGTASVTGSTLTWTIPSLGATATVTYKVTVDADAFNTTLVNAVTGHSDVPTGPPPTNCASVAPAAPATEATDEGTTPDAVLAAAVAACTTTHKVGPPPTTTPTTPSSRTSTPSGSLPFRSTPSGSLPFTGTQAGGMAGITLLLIALGVGLLVVRRRR